MGRRRKQRPGEPDRSAVLLLDKAVGPTSHDAVQAVRRASRQSRVGHTGTLDPAATGVLVVCLGRATKLVRFLQAGTKTYAARMVLGVETASQDAEGEVVARTPAGHIDERRFCEALTRFHGDIEQIPPMVSALKVDGERLHELARRGETIDREPRPVTIHDIVLDGFGPGSDPDHPEASFLVTCSAGTYVRTLAHDVGAALGVGGSLTALRRVANGPFTVDEAHTLEAVRAAAEEDRFDELLLEPLLAVQRVMPTLDVDDRDLVRRLTQGAKLPAELLTPVRAAGDPSAVAVRSGGQLIGVYAGSGPEVRAELVWLRPDELTTDEGR
ncbi:tRNA pseudouridine(55) synthase TruB [Nitriliruptor alkaliphilus]|uniref:tRNA pseudouridine(55) synthase TruB n=1 Tax=Nitriliruptor alkaliphilus TaxID=427918 RepID=UPI0006975120|nr:tRNA pseudouridine(55) synthase TruB [Nitriliruptor alkaliphilus]